MSGVGGIGGFLAWLVNTLASALIGLLVGAVVVAVMHVIPRRKGGGHGDAEAGESAEGTGTVEGREAAH